MSDHVTGQIKAWLENHVLIAIIIFKAPQLNSFDRARGAQTMPHTIASRCSPIRLARLFGGSFWAGKKSSELQKNFPGRFVC